MKHRYNLAPYAAWAIVGLTLATGAGPSNAIGSIQNVVLRVLLATPAATNTADFRPGPPIPEASLVSDSDFTTALKQYNPNWSFRLLGKLSAGTAAPKALVTPDLTASAQLLSYTTMPDGSVSSSLALAVEANNPGVGTHGFRSDNFHPSFAPDHAYLVSRLTDVGTPTQVIVFATLQSTAALAMAHARERMMAYKAIHGGAKAIRGGHHPILQPRRRLAGLPTERGPR